MTEVLEHPIIATVAAAMIGAALLWVARGARRSVAVLVALGRWVLPHFEPRADENGIPTDEHTLPSRLERLDEQLRHHMDDEIVLRREDLKRLAQAEQTDRHLADAVASLSAKLDTVIAAAGGAP